MCYGRTDLGLAQSFDDEARRVLLSEMESDVVITSPLTRCRQLAERISGHTQSDLRLEDAWIEMDFGAWELTPWSEVPRDGLDAWAADFMGYHGHGGESVAMLEARVRRALEITPHGAVVVTHSGCIRAACAIRGVGDGWDTDTPFGGIVRLD